MFDLLDILSGVPTPSNWFWWWVMLLPLLAFAIAYWITDGTGSGWAIAALVALFALLSAEFSGHMWKVCLRCGAALTVAGLGVASAAVVTFDVASGTGAFMAMHDRAFVPFMAVGLVLCALGGGIAMMRRDV